MRYLVNISGKNLAMTESQLAVLLTAVQDADLMDQKHVGAKKGSQGYDNAYVPTVECKQTHEWLQVAVMPDDFVDAIKLTMKLDKDES
jgi:hypothetical protein